MTTRLSAGRVRKINQFIKENRSEHSVETMCQLLEVSRSGYFGWLAKPTSDRAREDARLLRLIRASFKASHRIYGSLYDHLRDANPGGIPQKDAVQLFLWIFCTKDFLPPELRSLELSKEVLIDTFRRLSADGLIVEMDSAEALPSWENLVREFLLGNYAQDEGFLSRADKYLQTRS